MINKEYFNASGVAQLYFKLKGEKLEKQEAINRWRMVRNPDLEILNKVIDKIYKDQKDKLKKS